MQSGWETLTDENGQPSILDLNRWQKNTLQKKYSFKALKIVRRDRESGIVMISGYKHDFGGRLSGYTGVVLTVRGRVCER